MYPHCIRLRGPWKCIRVGHEPRRVTVPWQRLDWAPAGEPTVLARQFGYPGRIDADEHVWLTIARTDAPATVSLNDLPVGQFPEGPFEAEVTALLRPHNRLEIQTSGDQVGEVALEIRAGAYLKDVRVHREGGSIHVSGVVAGISENLLELYVLVGGHQAAYRTIAAGEAFDFPLAETDASVRVELVNVATVWYRVNVAADA